MNDTQASVVFGTSITAFSSVSGWINEPVPEWLLGMHVDWMDGVANTPACYIQTKGEVAKWPDDRWRNENGCWVSRHPDGRAQALYHRGKVYHAPMWRVYAGDVPITWSWQESKPLRGETPLQAARREGEENLKQCGLWYADGLRGPIHNYAGKVINPAELRLTVREDVAVTEQQNGFGGSHYEVRMEDGSTVLLRGPWAGGAPPGYVEVIAVNVEQKEYHAGDWTRNYSSTVFLSENLFFRALSRYCSPREVQVYRVVRPDRVRLECAKATWNAPKAAVYESERLRSARRAPAGPHWQVYWGSRVPVYGVE